MFGGMLTRKHADIETRTARLQDGLAKLESTAQQVDGLKATLAEQEVELSQKNEDANKLLEVVGAEQAKVQFDILQLLII